MPLGKILLWPLAALWWLGAVIRNWLYDSEFLNGAEFEIPVISIGNLSMGGTGKTPHVEYFLYRFRDRLKMAVLSRGYRRRSSGFRLAGPGDGVAQIGDEARQIKAKFRNATVAVGENRALAIPAILQADPAVEVILLDDAFQHRSVKPALNILLTTYDTPFWKDHLFPVGWLREPRKYARRADIVIVTKCPEPFTDHMEAAIREAYPAPARQKLFFSTFRYATPYNLMHYMERRELGPQTSVLLFSGIAGGGTLREEVERRAGEVVWMKYDDHYNYEQRDLIEIQRAYENLGGDDKMLLTTEKDAVRLEPYREWIVREGLDVFVLPVLVAFTGSNKDEFDKLVLEYLNYYRSGQD